MKRRHCSHAGCQELAQWVPVSVNEATKSCSKQCCYHFLAVITFLKRMVGTQPIFPATAIDKSKVDLNRRSLPSFSTAAPYQRASPFARATSL